MTASGTRWRWTRTGSPPCGRGTASSPRRATRRSRGRRSTAGAAPGSWSRSSSPRRCTARSAPGTLNPLGLSNIAPAIIQHGTEAQKQELLPRMLRGDDIWCQGFSEPDAGSDLASLKCTAVLDGDHFVVNGQKTWNTLGHLAELVRAPRAHRPRRAEAPRHLVPARRHDAARRRGAAARHDHRREGVQRDLLHRRAGPEGRTARPDQRGLAGRHDDARVRAGHRREPPPRAAGEDPEPARPRAGERERARTRCCANGSPRLYLEGELLKLVSDRAISGALHGRDVGPEGSIAKLVWSEAEQHLGEVAGDVLGADANSGRWGRDRVYMRALTIAGGTTQVNKNILATRILGLPRK